jgi:hypothetical protein
LEPHRRFEGIAPAVVRGIMTVKGSEAPMRQVKEDTESEVLGFAVGRRERALQHGARGCEVGRQMGVQHAREVLTALHESKRRQAGGGGATKRRGFKFRPSKCEIVREAVDRIAIEELEAWFFGDWPAVCAAYPKMPATLPKRAGFRDPDAIAGGTWEALERELQRKGYFKQGLRKMELARDLAARMDPARNRSASFRCLRAALAQL